MEINLRKPNQSNSSKLKIQIILLLSITFTFIVLYRKILFDANFYSEWTFRLDDKPWKPDNQNSLPIIFGHYFGDFQLPFGYLNASKIYDENHLVPNGIAPMGMIFIKLLSLFSLQTSYAFFVLLTLVSVFFAVYSTLNRYQKKYAVMISISLISFSLPLFVVFDRGNFIGIATSLFVISFNMMSKQNLHYNAVLIRLLLIIAISIKINLLFLLLFFIARFGKRGRRLVIRTVIELSIANLSGALIFKTSPLEVVRTLMKYSAYQSGGEDLTWLFGGVNLNQAIVKLFFGEYFCNGAWCLPIGIRFIPTITSILWLVLTLTLVSVLKRNEDLVKILVFSCMVITPPVAMTYTMLWSLYSIASILNSLANKKSIFSEKVLFLFLMWFNLPNFTPNLFDIEFMSWNLSDWKLINGMLLFALVPIILYVAVQRKTKDINLSNE